MTLVSQEAEEIFDTEGEVSAQGRAKRNKKPEEQRVDLMSLTLWVMDELASTRKPE